MRVESVHQDRHSCAKLAVPVLLLCPSDNANKWRGPAKMNGQRRSRRLRWSVRLQPARQCSLCLTAAATHQLRGGAMCPPSRFSLLD